MSDARPSLSAFEAGLSGAFSFVSLFFVGEILVSAIVASGDQTATVDVIFEVFERKTFVALGTFVRSGPTVVHMIVES